MNGRLVAVEGQLSSIDAMMSGLGGGSEEGEMGEGGVEEEGEV